MRRILALSTLSILLFTSCNGTQDADGMNICEIIDAQTITATVGENFTTERMDFDEQTQGCSAMNTDDEAINARNFNVIARQTNSENVAADEFERAANVWRNHPSSPRELADISGIGTKSVWTYGAETSQLITYEDDLLIILTLGHIDADNDATLEKARTITTLILRELNP